MTVLVNTDYRVLIAIVLPDCIASAIIHSMHNYDFGNWFLNEKKLIFIVDLQDVWPKKIYSCIVDTIITKIVVLY